MLALQQLLKPKAAIQTTEGLWQVARLAIDPATGEQLNVGVVFRPHGAQEPTVRFLRNMAGLRCLYGDDQAEDAAFLIDQAEQALEQGMTLPIGWNVSLGQPLFARGTSAQDVVDDLFARIVPLGVKEAVGEQLDTDDHTHATRHVRATVRRLLSKHMQTHKAPEFWRSKPIEATQNNHTVHVDVQIDGVGKSGQVHGAIASAWYKSKYHRSAYLDKGANAIVTSAKLFSTSTNVMYLLVPTARDGFTPLELRHIESDIESARWLIGQENARLAVFYSEHQMAHNILEDMGQL